MDIGTDQRHERRLRFPERRGQVRALQAEPAVYRFAAAFANGWVITPRPGSLSRFVSVTGRQEVLLPLPAAERTRVEPRDHARPFAGMSVIFLPLSIPLLNLSIPLFPPSPRGRTQGWPALRTRKGRKRDGAVFGGTLAEAALFVFKVYSPFCGCFPLKTRFHTEVPCNVDALCVQTAALAYEEGTLCEEPRRDFVAKLPFEQNRQRRQLRFPG